MSPKWIMTPIKKKARKKKRPLETIWVGANSQAKKLKCCSPNWAGAFAPSLDLEESKDGFVIHVDVPGVSQNDVKVTLLGDTLSIRGERKQVEVQSDHQVHRSERRYGSFERSFRLGVPVRADGVTATVRDGVLEVRVPKAEEAKTREITIQAGS